MAVWKDDLVGCDRDDPPAIMKRLLFRFHATEYARTGSTASISCRLRLIMRNTLLTALAALLVCGRTLAASTLSDVEIPYQKYVLPNGLTLVVHEDHKAPIVAVDVWYHVGSKDERPGRTG